MPDLSGYGRGSPIVGRMRASGIAVLTAAALLLSSCGGEGPTVARNGSGEETAASDVRVKAPGRLTEPLQTPDLLVLSSKPLPARVVRQIRASKGVKDAEVFSMAQFYVEEQPIRYAAVDPATFRRYTPDGTAQATLLWQRVAGGEIMVRPDIGKQVPTAREALRVGTDEADPEIHIGARAPLSPPIHAPYLDAVVNERWAGLLDMPRGNAMLLSTGVTSPQSIQKRLRRIAGRTATVQILGPNPDLSGYQQAILTSGSLAEAVGTFTYTVNRNGTVNPDRRWVRENIRTEQVPILGSVTCHKVMLVQLRAALREIVKSGLASKIHRNEYGGCYYPRFIGRDPRRGLSFHTWGTAIDLNVPGNQRGSVGMIDRRVVAIFIRWGFNWGGTWNWTDPMHFELARVVKPEKTVD